MGFPQGGIAGFGERIGYSFMLLDHESLTPMATGAETFFCMRGPGPQWGLRMGGLS